jgi:iron complex outermembrane receptor protein
VAISLSLPAFGQFSFDSDTVKIREVIISISKFSSVPAGYKKTSIDSATLLNYSNGNLSDVLSENTDIFIKSYGMGATATPSFRGTGASHTLIDWNGININSPMPGQSDLSIIPVGLIDDIQIYSGGASMSLNNGGIGGIINLASNPTWKKETVISLNTGIGSFGEYSGLMKVKTGNYSFQTITKGYFQNSENDFRYLNNYIAEPAWETRTNNQVSQRGFMQEVYVRNSRSITSARIWYQSADRNLPSTLLTEPNTGEKQYDESLRALLTYEISKGRTSYSFTGASILNKLNYVNRLASIDSRNLSEELTLKAGLENLISENIKLKIILDEKSIIVKTNNYDQHARRNTATMTVSLERNSGRFGSTFLLRELYDKRAFLIPDFSAGIQYKLTAAKEYFLRASFSRNSKIPSMNDMFWVPGGNRELKNEYALESEVSYEMNQKISGPLELKYNLAIFRYSIKDMIIWHPGQYSYWTADNIQFVNSTGLESNVTLNYTSNRVTSSLIGAYSFIKSATGRSDSENDNPVGKQLVYIPENKVRLSLRIAFGQIYSSWLTDYTGIRYITVDNSKYLPAYVINNLKTGIRFPVKSSVLDINFNIDNLFNKNYQSIAYYPLPGRSYFIKILFQLVK